MKIAFFTDFFPPQINGVVTYIIETANRLVLRGHEVLVIAPKPKREVKINPSQFTFKLIFLPSFPALFYPEARITIPSLPKLLVELKKFKTELIHIQAPFTVGTEGIFAGKILKLPLVATFHSFLIDKPFLEDLKLEKIADRLQYPLWSLYTSYHNLTDTIVCPTRIAQIELKKYGLSKPSIVIPHGINLLSIEKGFNADISHFYKKIGLKSTDKIGIYSGRLAADKSVEMLINIWKKVTGQIPNAKLLIIGTGPLEDKLKSVVKKLQLTGKVVFTGAVNRKVLIEDGLLRIGQIAVTASKIENPSYSLIEEMAFGLPIVAFRMRGIPEIVDKNNGILVPSDDIDSFAENIVDLFTDGTKLKKLSVGAKNKALEFDLEKNIESLENLYSKLIESNVKTH